VKEKSIENGAPDKGPPRTGLVESLYPIKMLWFAIGNTRELASVWFQEPAVATSPVPMSTTGKLFGPTAAEGDREPVRPLRVNTALHKRYTGTVDEKRTSIRLRSHGKGENCVTVGLTRSNRPTRNGVLSPQATRTLNAVETMHGPELTPTADLVRPSDLVAF